MCRRSALAISADAAFGVLRWRSQELNVKLFTTIARRLVADLPKMPKAETHRFDYLGFITIGYGDRAGYDQTEKSVVTPGPLMKISGFRLACTTGHLCGMTATCQLCVR